jgi:hypothetical protein
VDKSVFRSWPNGSGICAWTEASIWLRQSCVPLYSLPLTLLHRLPPASRLPRWSMVLCSGRNVRLPEAFLARLLRCNPTERCAVPLIAPSTRKNADPNTMGRCACCMPGALGIVGPARSASSAKHIPRRKNRDASAPCFGPSHRLLSRFLQGHPCRRRPLCLRLLPCAGGIGLVVGSADTGFSSSGGKR